MDGPDILWFAAACIFVRGVFALLGDLRGRSDDDEELTVESAMAFLQTPRQLDGAPQWLHYQCQLAPCDPPPSAGVPPRIVEGTKKPRPVKAAAR